MVLNDYLLLILVFFITSAVGVVTGSNSLINVPMMLQLNIGVKEAVATNMFGLTFMSIGASIPFLKGDSIDRKRIPGFVVLTLIGSALGAVVAGQIADANLKIIIAGSMFAVLAFMLLSRRSGLEKVSDVSLAMSVMAYILVFLLAIYGGLFSGGYVTMLTACLVALLGKTFTEAVATTKVINVFSSLIATLVFMWQGLVNYRLGAVLAVTMFIAAYIGAKTVTKMDEIWLKRIFLSVVAILATKTVIDILGM